MKLSLRTIASRLAYRIGRTTVGRLLRKLGFGLVANRKSLTGAAHPDRNRQFGYIRRVRQQFLRAGYPVISVDTKNKELVGNFANQGRTWRQAPEQVNLHDFPGDALGRAVPYGIYEAMSIWATPMIRPNAARHRTMVGRPRTSPLSARGQNLDPLCWQQQLPFLALES